MVLTASNIQRQFPTLELNPEQSGFHDNEAEAARTIDPGDTAADLETQGRLDGHSVSFEDPEGLASLQSSVDLFDSQASALAFLRRQTETFRRLQGEDLGEGFRLILETFEETPAPDIGVEATAGRLVADLLDHGLVAVFTFVSWVRGPVVASVLAQAFDEVERSAAVGRLAKRMNLRIDAILGVGG